MFGFNSPSAMRMIQHLQAANTPEPEPEPRHIRQTSRGRSRRAPSPPSSVSSSGSETSYSGSSRSSSASSSSYESDADVIYSHVVEKKKCAYVSPAGLRSKSKSGKEAIQHLKSKNCPEVPNLKKSARKSNDVAPSPAPPTPAPAASAPASQSETPKRSRKVRVQEAPVAAPEPVKEAPTPAVSAKSKRAPSAYNLFMKEHLKQGKSMVEISKLWKEKKPVN